MKNDNVKSRIRKKISSLLGFVFIFFLSGQLEAFYSKKELIQKCYKVGQTAIQKKAKNLSCFISQENLSRMVVSEVATLYFDLFVSNITFQVDASCSNSNMTLVNIKIKHVKGECKAPHPFDSSHELSEEKEG